MGDIEKLVKEIEGRKYITQSLLDKLGVWESIMGKILDGEEVSITLDNHVIKFRYFDDWAGTTKYTEYCFSIDGKVLPSTRQGIGGSACNYTNALSRVWVFLDYNDIHFLINNIETITKRLLQEYLKKTPKKEDLDRVEKLLEKIREE